MECTKQLIEVLMVAATMVRTLENEARVALYEMADKETFQKKMTEKTLILFHLPEEVDKIECDFGINIHKEIKNRIGGISFSAGKALNLDSVFYMSALLYPENYQDGDLNDLEQVIQYLEKNL